MLCKNCGKRVRKSDAFCKKCGVKIEIEPIVSIDDGMDTSKPAKFSFANIISKSKLSKKTLIAAISVGCALVIGVFGLLTWAFFANRVDLTDYIEIDDVTGLNDYASLEFEFDYVKLAKDLDLDDIRDIKELKDLEEDEVFYWGMKTSELKFIALQYGLDLDEFIDLYRAIEIKIDNDGSLKNGDTAKIEVVVSGDDEFDKKLVGGKMFFEVEGLKDALVVDLFSATSVVFNGESGKGTVSFDKKNSDSWMSSLVFSSTNQTDLSNGDTITVTATFTNTKTYETLKKELVREGKHLPKTAQKKFTVSGLSSYAQFEDIDDAVIEEAFNYIKATCLTPGYTNSSLSRVYWIGNSPEHNCENYLGKNGLIINMASTEYFYDSSHTINKICVVTDISKNENGEIIFGTTPKVLFDATGMHEVDIVTNINTHFKGYELVAIK